jgi:GxxExxY protein
MPIKYKGVSLDCGYRIDLVVDGTVVVELKSVEKVLPIHEAQLLTYMRLGAHGVGLLINFNVPVLKDCVVRRVL